MASSTRQRPPVRRPTSDTASRLDRDRFVEAMSGAATGVAVLTTAGDAGTYGVTVSAVSSVSADPPIVLACINRRSPAASAIRANGVLCINLLASGQSHVADCFAGRPGATAPFDFACANWTVAASGCARLAHATASFDCHLDETIDAGSHMILIGHVRDVAASQVDPLVYCGRVYRATAPLAA